MTKKRKYMFGNSKLSKENFTWNYNNRLINDRTSFKKSIDKDKKDE